MHLGFPYKYLILLVSLQLKRIKRVRAKDKKFFQRFKRLKGKGEPRLLPIPTCLKTKGKGSFIKRQDHLSLSFTWFGTECGNPEARVLVLFSPSLHLSPTEIASVAGPLQFYPRVLISDHTLGPISSTPLFFTFEAPSFSLTKQDTIFHSNQLVRPNFLRFLSTRLRVLKSKHFHHTSFSFWCPDDDKFLCLHKCISSFSLLLLHTHYPRHVAKI